MLGPNWRILETPVGPDESSLPVVALSSFVFLPDEPPPVVSFLDRPAGFEPLEPEVGLMVALPLQIKRLDQVCADLSDLAALIVSEVGQNLVNTEDVGSKEGEQALPISLADQSLPVFGQHDALTIKVGQSHRVQH